VKTHVQRIAVVCLTGLFLLSASAPVQACAVCFGRNDSDMAKGMNMGIFVLLGVILSVLGGAVSFFVYLARRAAAFHAANENAELALNAVEIKPGVS
jgi:hypothetical protein